MTPVESPPSIAAAAEKLPPGFDRMARVVIVAAVAGLGLRGITAGGLGWSDGPLHALDGALLLDFLRELPLDRIRAWADEFYLRHPSIGFIVYYPPGYAAVEALFYALGGVSIVTARVCILAHAAGASLLLYDVSRRLIDRRAALAAALLLLTSPHGAQWLFDIMLEWPATLWILATVCAALRFREDPRGRWAVLGTIAFIAAFLTKQTAGFIGPVLAILLLAERPARAAIRQPAVWSSLLVAATFPLIYLLAVRPFTALPSQLLQLERSDAFFYVRHFGETAGWPMTALAIVGLFALVRERNLRAGAWLLIWFIAWTAFSSVIAAKEPRYFFFALPPMAVLAGACSGIMLRDRRIGAFVVAWVVGLQALSAVREHPRYLPRYDMAVRALLACDDADLVLVDAVRDGQFIFDAYCDPTARNRLIPLRASKLLYARAAREKYGYQQFVNSPQDCVDLLARYGVRYVLIESALPRTDYRDADPPPRAMLRQALADADRFEPLHAWPLRCDDPAWNDVELRLYRVRVAPTTRPATITLPMPSMGRAITLPLPPRDRQ